MKVERGVTPYKTESENSFFTRLRQQRMRGTNNETCMFYSLLFILSWDVKLSYSNAWTVRMNEVGHVRSPLVRAVYLRMKEDERQRNDDHQYVGIVVAFSLIK